MKRILGIVGIIVLLLVMVLGYLMVNTIPPITKENTETISGTVERVYEPCCKDVVVQLQGEDRLFYINRGLEKGILPKDWNQKLKGKQVEIVFVPHNWTPLDPSGRMTTIAQISQQSDILYSQLNE